MTESDSSGGTAERAGNRQGGRRGGGRITFFAPALKHFETSEINQECGCDLASVSITGDACSLMCDHCRARILGRMPEADSPERLFAYARKRRADGAVALLVSGGSDREGRVPLEPFLPTIGRIHDELGMKVAVHTGITDGSLAAGLAAAGVDTVLIDVVGDDDTMEAVCHLKGVGTRAYSRSLANLCEASLRVVPHVVVGLDRGVIRGEFDALRLIREHDVAAVVLVGLRPLPETPLAMVEPPSPEAMGRVFTAARELFPAKPVLLGCERPAGEHKEQTDRLALEAGLDGIAYPADGIVSRARRMGLEPAFSRICCAMASGQEVFEAAKPAGEPSDYSGEERPAEPRP